MPTIEVPLQSWTEIAALKKSKTFKKRADEATALTAIAKLIKARREELSLEMYDVIDETLPDGIKTVKYDQFRLTRDKLLDVVLCLIPEDIEITEAQLTTKAGGKSPKFDKKLLMKMPIPCSNPKCKTENHVTVDIIEACTKYGERRPGVSIKLPGEENGDE